MEILQNWEKWKSFLGKQVENAKSMGLSENTIEKTAMQIGDYLAKNVDPKNEQERVLADLWSVAEESEKHALANCVMKLVQNKKVN